MRLKFYYYNSSPEKVLWGNSELSRKVITYVKCYLPAVKYFKSSG